MVVGAVDAEADADRRVLRHLVEHHRLRPERLSAAGYAQYKPLHPNDSPENREKNRRIEVKLLPVDAGLAGEAAAPPVASQHPL